MKHPVLEFVMKYLSDQYIPPVISDGKNLRLADLDLGLRNSIFQLADDSPTNTVPSIKEDSIYFVSDYYHCQYAFFRLPDRNFLFAGPYLLSPVNDTEIFQLMHTLNMPANILPQLQLYYRQLRVLPHPDTLNILLKDLYTTLFPDTTPTIRILDLRNLESQDDFLSKHQYLVSEEPVLSMRLLENRYHLEDELLDAISQGNFQKALSYVGRFRAISVDSRTDNPLRDTKNLIITFNTLLRRAAYLGGVHPMHLDKVSGNYVTFIENARSRHEIEELIPLMLKSYCNLVDKFNLSSYSEPIRHILMTVAASLTADLSLKRFAKDLYLNTSYLSALFKKEVGVPLTDYVNKTRIQQACKILKSTDRSVQDIAAQVGFPDIHYFNRLFRREMGTSPREWRIANK